MPMWIIWRRGLRGPSPALLGSLSRELTEYDRKNKLAEPQEIMPKEETWTLSEIAKLYPPPDRKDPLDEA